ncbi:M16 family metallopeptidase [Pedobacter heparinus]|uniref:Peptidase M16 domain protein n=1 Tax=Pedobacter heparinus (strain ATCC 13125 / DSM 2366 / CIP 104194 / JCM 7457 / NBRC 12017 / NCIMB 9290 / NRRL B-14731 / HIM 762-3) TaxID=485917 RepID=C6Y0V1_PEDHD|nr:pitrilysin family protein [Pedobacter heparinus]ACU04878.1 peptidase M16 domain protein [Pedobacter heparinus DSM 2366]
MTKFYILSICLIFFLFNVKAQHKAVSFEVNGLKVILRQTQKETVSMSMYFRGGVMNYSPQQAGIENLALAAAATCGTKNYKVTDYQELADEYGIRINGSSTTDYGTISMDCISKYFEQGWKLFSDAVLNPAFDKSEFQTTKEKIVSGIYQRFSNPERRIEQMSMQSIFYGSPYSTDPMGTDATVKGFTADSVSHYYHTQLLNKNKMFLVVAGRISPEDLEKKISLAFASLKAAPYTPVAYTPKVIEGEHLVTEQRNLATNYMNCVLNAPAVSNPDYYPFMLAVNALSGNMFHEIRTKQGLSYAPGARIKKQQMPYITMYVSTTQPKKSFHAMAGVFRSIKAGNYSQKFLDAIKKEHRLRYYLHQESSSDIVEDLGEAEILGGYQMLENMVANIDKVTLSDMNTAFNTYTKGAIWLYLGDEQLGREAFK